MADEDEAQRPTLQEEILNLSQKCEELEKKHKIDQEEKEKLRVELAKTQDDVENLKKKLEQLELENEELKKLSHQNALKDLMTYDPVAGILKATVPKRSTAEKPNPENKYKQLTIPRHKYEHEGVWIWHHGFMPLKDKNIVIDHMDGKKENNHVSNLRAVQQRENLKNEVPKIRKLHEEVAKAVATSLFTDDDMSPFVSRPDLKTKAQKDTGLNIDKMALCIFGAMISYNKETLSQADLRTLNFYQTPLRILCDYDDEEGKLKLKFGRDPNKFSVSYGRTGANQEILTITITAADGNVTPVTIDAAVAVWVWHHGQVLQSYSVSRKRAETKNKIESLYLTKAAESTPKEATRPAPTTPTMSPESSFVGDLTKILTDENHHPELDAGMKNVFGPSFQGKFCDLRKCIDKPGGTETTNPEPMWWTYWKADSSL